MDVKPLSEIQRRLWTIPLPENFDLLVAVARGGIIPATMLQVRLGIELRWIWMEFRDDHQTPRFATPRLARPLDFDPRGRRILLVDDRSRTGATLEQARAHLAGAALLRSLVVNGVGDYSLFDDECFYFPWRMDLPDFEGLGGGVGATTATTATIPAPPGQDAPPGKTEPPSIPPGGRP